MNAPHDRDELAALYAAGALSEDDALAVERAVRAGDQALADALARAMPVSDALFRCVAPVPPPPQVRDALLARVAGMAPPGAEPASDAKRIVVLRADAFRWKPVGVEGVEVCDLFLDPRTNRRTVLIRMAAGAVFPDHDHHDAEECLVLEGELEIAGVVLKRNDYIRTPAGLRHDAPRARADCLLLITCELGEVA